MNTKYCFSLVAVVMLFASHGLAAAKTSIQITDDYLLQEMRKRLSKGEECQCSCQLDVTALYNVRVLLRTTDPKLPSLTELGKTVESLRRERCGGSTQIKLPKTGSSGGWTSAKPRTRTTTYSYNLGASGGDGSQKMKLPEFLSALSKLEPKSRETLFAELPPTVQAASVRWAQNNRGVAASLFDEEFRRKRLTADTPAITSVLYGLEWSKDEIPLIASSQGVGDSEPPPLLKALEKVDPHAQLTFFNALPVAARDALSEWMSDHPLELSSLKNLAIGRSSPTKPK